MKVSLQAKAVFYFSVELALVKQLIVLSKRHYDGECQRASGQRGVPLRPGTIGHIADENGILTIWLSRFDVGSTDDHVAEVRATWDNLDLVSKICEFLPDDVASGVDWSKAREFRRQMARMLNFAGPKITKEWKADFEV